MDLSSLPPEWRAEIESQIATYGLEATKRMNAQWAAANPNVPGAQALLQWSGGSAAPATNNPPANNPPANTTAGGNTAGGNTAGGTTNVFVPPANTTTNTAGGTGGTTGNQSSGVPPIAAQTGAPSSGNTPAVVQGPSNQSGTQTGGDPGAHERNLQGEAANTLQAQINLAGPAWQAYNQYSGLYAQTDLNNLRNSLFGSVDAGQFLETNPEFREGYENAKAAGQDAQAWLNQAVNSSTYLDQSKIPRGGGIFSINQALTNEANKQTVAGNTALRAGNLADATSLGSGALNLLKSLNPEQYEALSKVNSASTTFDPNSFQNKLGSIFTTGPQYQNVGVSQIGADQVNATQNPTLSWAQNTLTNSNSPLGEDLQRMAREQLALGSGLSEEQKRNATQAAREAWAARGLINSNGAVGAEVLNRDQYGQQLLNQRQQFASGVNQLGMQQQALNTDRTNSILNAGFNQGAQNLAAAQGNQQANLTAGQANLEALLRAALANQSSGLQAQSLNNQLGLNLASMDYGRQQQGIQNLFNNAQLQSASAFNPFALTGATTANAGSNAGMFGMGGATGSGGTGNSGVQSMFSPFNQYASNLYGQNYAGVEDARANAEEVSAGKSAGWLNFAGNVIGGAMKAFKPGS